MLAVALDTALWRGKGVGSESAIEDQIAVDVLVVER
jgi:hypothetical protein